MPQQFTYGHALLIGVGSEQSQTVRDATALATLLADPLRCAYPGTQVQLIAGAQATHANIFSALEKLTNRVDANIPVILYFGIDSAETIDNDDLLAKINTIPTQKLLLLLDGLPFDQLAMLKVRGRVILTATHAQETAYVAGNLSYFAQAVVEAFVGSAASASDGYVRAADLASYVLKQVAFWTLDRQHPRLVIEQNDNFELAFYAAGEVEPIGLPTFLQPQALSLESMPVASIEPREKAGVGRDKSLSFGEIHKSAADPSELERIDRSQRTFDQRSSTVEGNQTNVAGDQHIGQQINYIVQGGEGIGHPSAQPRTVDSTPELISETIRLDVAKPAEVFVDETFDIAVAIRQPDSSLLNIADLTSVTAEEGEIYRREENEIVLYRVEVSAPDCDVEPTHLTFRLKAGENSRPRYFHITPRRQGRISLHVSAYQEDDELAAQTRVTLVAAIHAA